MGSSHKAIALLCMLIASACSVGHGEGEINGTVSIGGCRRMGPYQLRPTAFFAEDAEQVLKIRIQRGSDIETMSDGLSVLVTDARQVKEHYLGRDLQVGSVVRTDEDPAGETRVDLTLFLNESCPAERTKTPVALSAVDGTIRFDHIYAPKANGDDVRISATLTGVQFEDERTDDRWATLNGSFEFLYVRGSPAQRFP